MTDDELAAIACLRPASAPPQKDFGISRRQLADRLNVLVDISDAI
jgi:hypothetical protein